MECGCQPFGAVAVPRVPARSGDPTLKRRFPRVSYKSARPEVCAPNNLASLPSSSHWTDASAICPARRHSSPGFHAGSERANRTLTAGAGRRPDTTLSSSSSVAAVQEQKGWANRTIVGAVCESRTAVPSGQRLGPAVCLPAVPLNATSAPSPNSVAATETVIIATSQNLYPGRSRIALRCIST